MKKFLKISIDVWMSFILLALSVFMLIMTRDFPESAARFPKLVLYLNIVLSLAVIIESIIKYMKFPNYIVGLSKEKVLPAIKIFVLVVSYFVVMAFLGFVISTILFCVISIKFMGGENFLINIIIAIGFIIFVYIAFVMFLRVPIPMLPKIVF